MRGYRGEPRRLHDSLATVYSVVQNLVLDHDAIISQGLGFSGRNKHIETVHLKMYIGARSGYVEYLGEMRAMNVIVLATINVAEQFQRHGIFKALLQDLSQLADQHHRILRIENVLNEHLHGYLSGLPNWREDQHYPGSFYKLKTPSIPESPGRAPTR